MLHRFDVQLQHTLNLRAKTKHAAYGWYFTELPSGYLLTESCLSYSKEYYHELCSSMLEYKLQKDHCLYSGVTTPFPVFQTMLISLQFCLLLLLGPSNKS